MSAPVGRSKYDDVHLTVITDKEWLKDMGDVVNANMESSRPHFPFYQAPALILISSKLAEKPAIEYANSGCIAQSIALAARSLDLGSVLIWVFVKYLKEQPELLKRLNLPEDFVPMIGVAVGHSAMHLEKSDHPRHVITVNRI